MAIAIATGSTTNGVAANFSAVGRDAYIAVACSIWGDGNYGIGGGSGFARPGYKQLTSEGAQGVYYKHVDGDAPTGIDWNTTGSHFFCAWIAMWKIKDRGDEGSGESSTTGPGSTTATFPNHNPTADSRSGHDYWIAVAAHNNTGSGAIQTLGGWTNPHSLASNAAGVKTYYIQSTGQDSVSPGVDHTNECDNYALMTAHVRATEGGGGWGAVMAPKMSRDRVGDLYTPDQKRELWTPETV